MRIATAFPRIKTCLVVMGVFIFHSTLVLSAERPEIKKRSFLWKIGSEPAAVYLLGSIHAAQEDMYPLPDAMMQAYRDSQILVVEANLEKTDSMQVQQEVMSAAASDQLLQERLPPEVYESLQIQFEEAEMSLSAFSNFHPWFAALQLTMLRIQQLGYDPSIGIDHYFIQKAAQSGREIRELENAFSQIQILSGLTAEEEDQFVRYSLESMTQLSASLEKLKSAWMRGDARELAEEMIEKPLRKNPALLSVFEKLFFVRNQEMTEKILGYLGSGKNHFVVVGAGHLVGKRGILDLLEKQGILAEQL